MKKNKRNEDVKGIIYEGVEYIKTGQAVEMTGLAFQTFKKRAAQFEIESINLPLSRYPLFKKQEIVEAIHNGWMQSYI